MVIATGSVGCWVGREMDRLGIVTQDRLMGVPYYVPDFETELAN